MLNYEKQFLQHKGITANQCREYSSYGIYMIAR